MCVSQCDRGVHVLGRARRARRARQRVEIIEGGSGPGLRFPSCPACGAVHGIGHPAWLENMGRRVGGWMEHRDAARSPQGRAKLPAHALTAFGRLASGLPYLDSLRSQGLQSLGSQDTQDSHWQECSSLAGSQDYTLALRGRPCCKQTALSLPALATTYCSAPPRRHCHAASCQPACLLRTTCLPVLPSGLGSFLPCAACVWSAHPASKRRRG